MPRNPNNPRRRGIDWEKRRATAKVSGARWKAENRERVLAQGREYYRKVKSRILAKMYPPATRPMPEVCECCGRPPTGRKSLGLDHDHVTGKFRGWLCMRCNTALGKLGDNLAGVRMALAYLERAQ